MANSSELCFLSSLDFEQHITAEEASIETYSSSTTSIRTSPTSESREVPRDIDGETFSYEEGNDLDPNLVDWDGPDDPENPKNFSYQKKLRLTALALLLTINATYAISTPTTTTRAIAAQFHVSQETGILVTSLFLVGYLVGPPVWSGLSEVYGRRPVFLVAVISYIFFSMGQPLANNIETLLITRFIAGFFASVSFVNGGGLIADIWDPVGRGKASAVYCAAGFLSPVLGPVVGSFVVSSSLGWQWVFWVMIIFSSACWAIMAVSLPETYAPVLLSQKASRLRMGRNPRAYTSLEKTKDSSLRGTLDRTIFRPFIMLTREPILFLITLYIGLMYGLLFALFEVFPILFIELRGIKPSLGGLFFIGVGIGNGIGATYFFYIGNMYAKLVVKWRGYPPPEARLGGAMVGGPLLVQAIFWMGWAGAYPSVPWYVVELATVQLGCSMALVFISFIAYIIDTYSSYAAPALAANSMVRNAAAAVFPLFTRQLFHNLGVQWASTLLGCIALLMAPIPFLFWKYGAQIRGRSTFAPCRDLEIKEEIEREKIEQRLGLPYYIEELRFD